jgi:hypothetical protein
LPQYIRAFVPGGTFFFMGTLIEHLGKLMMLTKGGMRYAFPAYVLRAERYLAKNLYFAEIHQTWRYDRDNDRAVFLLDLPYPGA